MTNKPGKPTANSAAGNALATTLMPGSAALAAAMAPKAKPLQTMDEHADTLHPVVNVTPNRVTGRFSNE